MMDNDVIKYRFQDKLVEKSLKIDNKYFKISFYHEKAD